MDGASASEPSYFTSTRVGTRLLVAGVAVDERGEVLGPGADGDGGLWPAGVEVVAQKPLPVAIHVQLSLVPDALRSPKQRSHQLQNHQQQRMRRNWTITAVRTPTKGTTQARMSWVFWIDYSGGRSPARLQLGCHGDGKMEFQIWIDS